MRRRDFKSDAEYYRAHRQAFALALELGCTPADAELELAARRAREGWHASQRRLACKVAGTPTAPPADPPRPPTASPERAYASTQRLLGEHD